MIKVAVGIIYNETNEILIAKRTPEKHLAGFWEFPGGKLEPHETTKEALKRELKEEVGLDVLQASPLTEINFTYPEKQVLLDVWKVEKYVGVAQGLEGQEIQWVYSQNLQTYNFPEANQQIFKFL